MHVHTILHRHDVWQLKWMQWICAWRYLRLYRGQGSLRYHIRPAPPTPLSRGGPDACHAFSKLVYNGYEGRALITVAIY